MQHAFLAGAAFAGAAFLQQHFFAHGFFAGAAFFTVFIAGAFFVVAKV